MNAAEPNMRKGIADSTVATGILGVSGGLDLRASMLKLLVTAVTCKRVATGCRDHLLRKSVNYCKRWRKIPLGVRKQERQKAKAI